MTFQTNLSPLRAGSPFNQPMSSPNCWMLFRCKVAKGKSFYYAPNRQGSMNSVHLVYRSRCSGTCRHSSSVLLCPHLPLALVNISQLDLRGGWTSWGKYNMWGQQKSCFVFEPSCEILCFFSCLGATNSCSPPLALWLVAVSQMLFLDFRNALSLLENYSVGSVLPCSLSCWGCH